uniref:Uncharacterized protein n=2 Tax=Picea TaxID=3328 RepID=A0A101M1Z1_PICGL|nr:hypothetical protein ABT39_MTgene4035 [Picea glauca]QHR89733.1 hypothetical protein Q903MT_gene3755 [Picea sitchensis]
MVLLANHPVKLINPPSLPGKRGINVVGSSFFIVVAMIRWDRIKMGSFP